MGFWGFGVLGFQVWGVVVLWQWVGVAIVLCPGTYAVCSTPVLWALHTLVGAAAR